MKQHAGIAILVVLALILSGCASSKSTSQAPAQEIQASPAPQKTAAEQQNSPQQTDKPSDTSADSCSNLNGKTLFTIPEAGITLPVDSSMAGDLIYKVIKNPAFDPAKPMKGTMWIGFSSKKLSALSKFCSLTPQYKGDMALGSVAITVYPTDPKVLETDPYVQSHPTFFKQLGGLGLAYQDPQESCSEGKNVDLERKVSDTVLNAFKCVSLTNGK